MANNFALPRSGDRTVCDLELLTSVQPVFRRTASWRTLLHCRNFNNAEDAGSARIFLGGNVLLFSNWVGDLLEWLTLVGI